MNPIHLPLEKRYTRLMKTKIIILGLVGIVAVAGIFLYVTRPVSAPTEEINNDVVAVPQTGDTTEKVMSIVQSESKAEFSLNEVLRGTPTKVIGTTNQIAGNITIKSSAPAKITIGEVKVNARTLKTDSEQRNGAIARLILKSEESEFEYITFTPTVVIGVPSEIKTDLSFPFTVTGNLTIRGMTKSVSFAAQGTLRADGSFAATADHVVTYADFGVSVPNLPFLANVDKTAKISVSIVAR